MSGLRSEHISNRLFFFMLVLISVYGIIQHYWGVDWLRPEGRKKITPYTPDFIKTGIFHAKGNFTHHLTYSHYLVLVFPLRLRSTPQDVFWLLNYLIQYWVSFLLLILRRMQLLRISWVNSEALGKLSIAQQLSQT